MLRRFAISCLIATVALRCPARTRPHYGGTIRVEIEGDPWSGPDGLARRLVFDGLTALTADGVVHPGLSMEWEASDNDHRWQFLLRNGVHFQDGAPLTSAAVAASLNISCPQNCPWNAVRAAGPLVIFTFDSPTPNLPALLARDEFLITEITAPDGTVPKRPVGTGPFTVTKIDDGVATLSANDDCWQGRPFVDAIEIRGHRAIREQWLDLNVGRADLVQIPPEMQREAHRQQLKVVASPLVTLLALQVSDSGSLSNPALRGAIASAVDRSAMFNVIFQKQGEIAGGLLPQGLTGYAFLFPTERDLNKANERRGGLTIPLLRLAVEGNGAMQLAAQRISLNLHEAGFNVQMASSQQRPDLILRELPIEGADPAVALESVLKGAGQFVPVTQHTPEALFQVERRLLDLNTVIPLIDLSRAYAIGGRVRDLALRADGTPSLADVCLEDAP